MLSQNNFSRINCYFKVKLSMSEYNMQNFLILGKVLHLFGRQTNFKLSLFFFTFLPINIGSNKFLKKETLSKNV